MNEKQSNVQVTGISFSGALGIAFIVLKLTGYISWPWIWVLAPVWGPLAFLIVLFLITMAIMMTIELFT